MHVSLFDPYQSGTSLIHRLDPRAKLVVAVLFILSNALLPDGAWLAFLLSWGMVLSAGCLAGLGLFYPLKRSLIALPFFLVGITAIVAVPGQAIGFVDIGSWRLVATDAGIVRFGSIVARSWISVQMAILLTATTQFPDIVHALRHLKVPQILVSIIVFMYRYLFVLAGEAVRLLRARQARSAQFTSGTGGGSIRWRARVTGNMAGQLFLRSYERSERVYAAMLSRGYKGQLLTLNPHELDTEDWLSSCVAILLLFLFQLFART